MKITVQLNGSKVVHDVEPRETLADFVRDRCGLTATHLGCEHGACGACTVVADGEATRSCLVLAVMCDGRSIDTLEGLRDDPTMAVLRKHFHESHGVQCGFCTPGMLIMARDILARLAAPDSATVRHELSGQVCRCTGYAGIVKAIVAAGKELAACAQSISSARASGCSATWEHNPEAVGGRPEG
jgi:carbon-monoxide dehydrogenase small subunit